jgi:predicted DCC family thiol-disulfide oxidoreductase YuxK
MFKRIYKKFTALYDKQIDGKGLAIFRIAFCVVLLGEVLQLFYFRHLIFDKIPYLIPGEIEMWPVLLFWIIALVFIIFGLFTRTAALINYLLSVVVIGTITSFEYHMFYSYLIINFLFIFLPISKTISLDRLLLKLKYSNTQFRYHPPVTVSALSYYLPVLLGVGFFYFDSVFFKFNSKLWLTGLGLWLPSSLPQAIFANISPLLNIKYLVIGMGYLTLIFESLFLFVFWRKKWRIPTLVIGIGLHIGILICFPIPFFALGFSAIYLLMVPVKFWRNIFNTGKQTKKALKVFYDNECPICIRTIITLNHFDSGNRIEFIPLQNNAINEPALKGINPDELLKNIYSVNSKGTVYVGFDTYIKALHTIWYLMPIAWILRVPGIYHLGRSAYKAVAVNRTTERCTEDNCGYVLPALPANDGQMKILNNLTLKDIKVSGAFWGIAICIILQFCVTYNAPFFKAARKKAGIANLKIVKLSGSWAGSVTPFSKVFLGITHHGLFTDSHFNGYNHTIAITYKPSAGKEKWLPVFDQDGTPGNYLFGPLWAKWTFRVNAPLVNQKRLTDGVRDFTAFWAYKNHISLKNAVFEIRVKKNIEPKKWEYDFLNKQLKNPWLNGGKVVWTDEVYHPEIQTIEEM